MKEIITNPKKLKEMKELVQDYFNLHVLSDFDRTLTYGTTAEGEKRPSLISVLRNGDYLDEDYARKAKDLFKKYHPIEVDPEVSPEEKKKAMQEWWTTHNKLLIKKNLSKQDLRDIIESGDVRFRKGVPEFLNYLHRKEIPLVIISAGGAGESIPMFFKKNEVDYPNIHFIVNRFEWKNGIAQNYKEPIIHSLNKDETVLREFPEIYREVKDRKNVILMGDGKEDINMIEGFEYDNLFTVGVLCYAIDENREEFKKSFDVVLEGDGNFDFINEKLFGIQED